MDYKKSLKIISEGIVEYKPYYYVIKFTEIM